MDANEIKNWNTKLAASFYRVASRDRASLLTLRRVAQELGDYSAPIELNCLFDGNLDFLSSVYGFKKPEYRSILQRILDVGEAATREQVYEDRIASRERRHERRRFKAILDPDGISWENVVRAYEDRE